MNIKLFCSSVNLSIFWSSHFQHLMVRVARYAKILTYHLLILFQSVAWNSKNTSKKNKQTHSTCSMGVFSINLRVSLRGMWLHLPSVALPCSNKLILTCLISLWVMLYTLNTTRIAWYHNNYVLREIYTAGMK